MFVDALQGNPEVWPLNLFFHLVVKGTTYLRFVGLKFYLFPSYPRLKAFEVAQLEL